MSNFLKSTSRAGSIAVAILTIGTVVAHAADNGNSNEAIYCHNLAVNDYYDNVASCERNLSDIPDQLALCKQDAREDLARADEACGYKSASISPRPRNLAIDGGGLTVLGGDDGGRGPRVTGKGLSNKPFVIR